MQGRGTHCGFLAAVYLVLVVACVPVAESPSATPSASESESPTPTPSGMATPVPPSPSPTNPTLPTATVRPTSSSWTEAIPPSAEDWRYLDDFPFATTLEVADVVATAEGFVAVGTDFPQPDATAGDWFQGAVWVSSDGVEWDHLAPETFGSTRMQHIVSWNGTLLAFGTSGNCLPHAGCDPVPENAGTNVWRSPNGVEWEQLPHSDVLGIGSVEDVGLIGEQLIAVGRLPSDDPDRIFRGSIWLSNDAFEWLQVDAPETNAIVTVVTNGTAIGVFAGDVSDEPTAWNSDDLGVTWRPSAIEATACHVEEGALVEGRVVVVGSGNVSKDELGPCALSTDATLSEWRGGFVENLPWRVFRKLLPTPAGLLAVGARYEPGTTRSRAAFVALSSDGVDWNEIADLPELRENFGFVQAAAAGPKGIVVFGTVAPEVGVEPSTESNLRVWHAPFG